MDKMNGTDHWWMEILFGFGNVLVCCFYVLKFFCTYLLVWI